MRASGVRVSGVLPGSLSASLSSQTLSEEMELKVREVVAWLRHQLWTQTAPPQLGQDTAGQYIVG